MANALVRINGNVPWNVLQGKGGNWVAICEPLKLTLQAETFSELAEEIAITLNATLTDLMASNELPKFLQDHGWQLVGPMPSVPQEVRFDVPFSLIAENHGSTRPVR